MQGMVSNNVKYEKTLRSVLNPRSRRIDINFDFHPLLHSPSS